MSAVFKIAAKKKYSQNDLRRLMQEQKSKTKTAVGSSSVEKIDSPFAKYEKGQLMCSLCKSLVRSENVWKVHINSKTHKENIATAKQLKEQLLSKTYATETIGAKRPATDKNFPAKLDVPEKKLKSAIDSAKTSEENTSTNGGIPNDFFDTKSGFFAATLQKTSIKKDVFNNKRIDTSTIEKMETNDKDETLPEGFFDDPIKDAKIRNIEYKDPQDEEWEKFKREMKEESTFSNAIIAGEQEVATTERQIEEIDEQIRKWSKVLDLEKKKNIVANKLKERSMKMDEDSSDSDSDLENEFNEFPDWRSKKFSK